MLITLKLKQQLRKLGEHFGTGLAECPRYRGFVIAAVDLV